MENHEWFAQCQKAGIVEKGHFILHGGAHKDVYVNFATLLALRGPLLDNFIDALVPIAKGPMNYTIIGTGNGAHIANLLVARVHQLRKVDALVSALPRFAYATRFESGGRMEFRRNQAVVVKNSPVLIIDDVFVTGSTLGELEELVWRTGGLVRGEAVLLNHSAEVITERVTRKPSNATVPFHSVFQWSAELWRSSADCPSCRKGIPINLEVGKGADFHRLYGHPIAHTS